MDTRNTLLLVVLLLTSLLSACQNNKSTASRNLLPSELLQQKEWLGRQIFFDNSLSEPAGQSCSSCHLPTAGFSDPDKEIPVSRGVNPQHFGNRNTPTIGYIGLNPEFHYDKKEQLYIGGFFHDGRAATLKEQAKGPFLNPLEMGNPNATTVVTKVSAAPYAELMKQVYGDGVFENPTLAYDHIADAIAAFERTDFFQPFTSKYDYYLRGQVKLTKQEERGLKLFEDEKKGNCAACHPSKKQQDGSLPLFTDYSYDNLGIPKLKKNPFYGVDKSFNPDQEKFVDYGLGGVLKEKGEMGKFKVPTLRNIAKTGPYMHNGIFTTLEEAVEFYNSRDTDKKWGKPEVLENVNKDELGDLELNKQELADIVAFLQTLSDNYNFKN